MNFERERREFACLIMHSLTWIISQGDYDYSELEIADECDKIAQKYKFKLDGNVINTEWAYEDADKYAKRIFKKCVRRI